MFLCMPTSSESEDMPVRMQAYEYVSAHAHFHFSQVQAAQCVIDGQRLSPFVCRHVWRRCALGLIASGRTAVCATALAYSWVNF